MLPKNSIHKITDYYFSRSEFQPEIERSFLEFFGADNFTELQREGVEEEVLPLLNEWFIYNFKLKNGKSPLRDYVERHELFLNSEEKLLYAKLIETNFYSLFEVKEVRLGKGLLLTDLRSGKSYDVIEKSATYGLKPGMFFHDRVAEINGHWELVGSDPAVIDVKLTNGARQLFRRAKGELTPKQAYENLFASRDFVKEDHAFTDAKSFIDAAAARNELARLLQVHGLDNYVSLDTLEGWIRDNDSVEAFPEILSLLAGLNNCQMSESDLDVFANALTNFYNTVPQKFLNYLTPEQAYFQHKLKGGKPHLLASFTALGGEKWHKAVSKAHQYMHVQDYRRAAVSFDKAFKFLLEEKATRGDIYRVYANAAMCRFGIGEEREGKLLLNMALELNPNYDFGQMVRQRYENGEFGPFKQMQNFEKFKAENPAVKYFDWIKSLEINFKSKSLTISEINAYDQKGKKIREVP